MESGHWAFNKFHIGRAPIDGFNRSTVWAEEAPRMPRFYFHTNNPSEGFAQDDEGLEFSSIHEAKCQGVAYAGRLLQDVAETFWDDADFELTVTDDRGLILFVMRVFGTEAPAIRAASQDQ